MPGCASRMRCATRASPAAIRPYPSQWATDTELPAIGAIRIRPIRPEDETLYADFFARVAPDDQRLRFFTAGPDLSHRFLARLHPDRLRARDGLRRPRQDVRRAARRRPLRRRSRLHHGRIRHPGALRPQGLRARLAAHAASSSTTRAPRSSRSSTATCWPTTPPCSTCAASSASPSPPSPTTPARGGCASGSTAGSVSA